MLRGSAAIEHAEKHSLPLAAQGRPGHAAMLALDAAHARDCDPDRIYLPVIDLFGTYTEGDACARLAWSRLGVTQVLFSLPVESYAEGRHVSEVLLHEALDRLPRCLLPLDVYQEAQRVRTWVKASRG